jgi:hypothetical protein
VASAGDEHVDPPVDGSPAGGKQPDNEPDPGDTPTENLGNLGKLIADIGDEGPDILVTVPVLAPVPPPLAVSLPASLPARRWRPSRRRAGRSGKPSRSLPLTLSMAILLLANVLGARTWRSHGNDAPAVADAGPATGTATSPSTTASTPAVDLTRPFATTPAANWGDGPDGIALPAAAPVGGHPAAEVANGYALVKQALIAAHLDQKMLISHDPSTYLALLAPATRATERTAITASADPDEGGEVSLFAAGFHLLPVPIKVSGTMTASTDNRGLLVVHANYVYAYPFAPTDRTTVTEAWQIVAVQHVAEDFTVVSGHTYRPSDRGLWVTSSQSYDESIACTASKHGYLAPAYSEPQDGVHGDNDPNAYFDPKHDLNINTTCPS